MSESYLLRRILLKCYCVESEDKICGTCRSCQMIENEGHVNVYVIRPEGNSIKKGADSDVCNRSFQRWRRRIRRKVLYY